LGHIEPQKEENEQHKLNFKAEKVGWSVANNWKAASAEFETTHYTLLKSTA